MSAPLTMVEQGIDIGAKKVWGKRSLTLGELICFAIGGALIVTQKAGKHSTLIGLAVIFIGQALF